MENKRYGVTFNRVKGFGVVRQVALNEHFDDLALAWQASSDAFQASGLCQKLAKCIAQVRRNGEIRNQIGLPFEHSSLTLVLMKLNGMVRQVSGMNNVALREEEAGCRV